MKNFKKVLVLPLVALLASCGGSNGNATTYDTRVNVNQSKYQQTEIAEEGQTSAENPTRQQVLGALMSSVVSPIALAYAGDLVITAKNHVHFEAKNMTIGGSSSYDGTGNTVSEEYKANIKVDGDLNLSFAVASDSIKQMYRGLPRNIDTDSSILGLALENFNVTFDFNGKALNVSNLTVKLYVANVADEPHLFLDLSHSSVKTNVHNIIDYVFVMNGTDASEESKQQVVGMVDSFLATPYYKVSVRELISFLGQMGVIEVSGEVSNPLIAFASSDDMAGALFSYVYSMLSYGLSNATQTLASVADLLPMKLFESKDGSGNVAAYAILFNFDLESIKAISKRVNGENQEVTVQYPNKFEANALFEIEALKDESALALTSVELKLLEEMDDALFYATYKGTYEYARPGQDGFVSPFSDETFAQFVDVMQIISSLSAR